jgi:hypothetical protein
MSKLINKIPVFRKISEINPDDNHTWDDSIYLTFDIDWACDEILADSIELVEKMNVSATWYVTNQTSLLKRLTENPIFELGIHPNFNFLLEGDSRNSSTAKDVVTTLSSIVPSAKSIRSHSLTWGDVIAKAVLNSGFLSVSNFMIPEQSKLLLKPWRDWYGLIHIPYFFQDSACFYFEDNASIKELNLRPGLKVFDFHPIHVFLNSENISRYESTRHLHKNPKELIKHRYDGFGTRTRLIELLQLSSIY